MYLFIYIHMYIYIYICVPSFIRRSASTEKTLRIWSQQARQLTPRRGNSRASRESGALCSTFTYGSYTKGKRAHTHTEGTDPRVALGA